MNLKETKYYFEDMFSSYWTETPIHFAGMEFDGSQHDRWVNPVYKPLRSRSNGISTSTDINMGQFYVVCWGESDIDAMELSDTTIEFMADKLDTTKFRSRGYEIIDHGWDNSNKVFVMLSFAIEQFEGVC